MLAGIFMQKRTTVYCYVGLIDYSFTARCFVICDIHIALENLILTRDLYEY